MDGCGALDDPVRGAHGAQGMIRLRVRAVPERHEGIAHELIQGTFLLEDGLGGQ